MALIKEFVSRDGDVICIIRSTVYSRSFDHLNKMIAEARKDFRVGDQDINIVKYVGDSYARTMGIEFQTIEEVPAEYVQIKSLERGI